MQKKIEARTRRAKINIVNRNVIQEKIVMKKREIDIVTIGENVTESVTEIEEVTVTGIVNGSARERTPVTANQRVREGGTLRPQRKNERIRPGLKKTIKKTTCE